MKKSLLTVLTVFFALNLVSCNNDDDSSSEDERDRGEQAPNDAAVLKEFMDTHTYNIEDFAEEGHILTDQDIKFSKITESNQIKLSEINTEEGSVPRLITKTHRFLVDEELFEQEYFIIKVREGSGSVVKEADNINLTYQEKLIVSETEYSFDDSTEAYLVEQNRDSISNNTWINALTFTSMGLSDAFTDFRVGSPMSESPCDVFGIDMESGNVTSNNDFGIGIAIVPSGLAYFATEQFFNNERDDDRDSDNDEIEDEDTYAYRNYVYTFSTFNVVDANLDGDNIPAYLEGIEEFIDTDEDGIVDFKGIDTDEDGIPDYLDSDDDGDNILTFLEVLVSDLNEEIDQDCDGIPSNDNQVQYIVTESEENGEVTKVKYVLPSEVTGGQIPYHLDDSIEFDESDYDDDGNLIEEN